MPFGTDTYLTLLNRGPSLVSNSTHPDHPQVLNAQRGPYFSSASACSVASVVVLLLVVAAVVFSIEVLLNAYVNGVSFFSSYSCLQSTRQT